MSVLDEIRPSKKLLVFDLVEEAGLDMSDWIASSNNPSGVKANPKYCYEWSFVEPGQVVILNLWHESMIEENGTIIERGNFRADAERHRGPQGKAQWFQRGKKLDQALQTALRDNLPIRVIINSGERRKPSGTKASRVLARQLDPKPWTILEYDWSNGAHVLQRGIVDRQYVDQFDIEQEQKSSPEKREQSGSVFVRDPKVRDAVKRRSGGNCEYCGDAGFVMESGALYLETHHIDPLGEGGTDSVGNVIALCPKDHRMAHFSRDAATMRSRMKAIVGLKAASD
ncbi:HNH endonuclease [Altererythrobacter sp. Z27]|uniref:HNH endonuclease n=1 Tax=Altererythrobacter sp. Z27 TaxID=3461147 RepID=UPI004044D3DB